MHFVPLLAALLSGGLGAAASPPEPTHTPVFTAGEGGYHTYRIPAALVTGKGTLLAFCEGRKRGTSDTGNIDLVLKRSRDGGRSWGPLEPFDNAFPELLCKQGVYSHLITDHFHYWEDGGATYHNRYDSYEFVRGQEGDPWKAMVQPHWERLREKYHARQFSTEPRSYFRNNMINREFIREESEFIIEQQVKQAQEDLRHEVAAAAVALAEKIVRSQMGPADQQRLIDGFVGDVASGNGHHAGSPQAGGAPAPAGRGAPRSEI